MTTKPASPVEQHEAAPVDAEVEAAAREYDGIPLDVARGLARAAIRAAQPEATAPLEGTGNGADERAAFDLKAFEAAAWALVDLARTWEKAYTDPTVLYEGLERYKTDVERELHYLVRCYRESREREATLVEQLRRAVARAPRTEVAGAVQPSIEYRYEGGTFWCDLGPAERMRPDFKGVYRLKAGEFPVWGGDEPSVDAAAEDKYVIERLSTVLAGVTVALLGEEADRPASETLQKLPEEAAKLRLELDLYRAQAADAAAAPADERAPFPRYTEWMHMRTHGAWSDGVPAWARDHTGRMNDFTAATAVIEELAACASSPNAPAASKLAVWYGQMPESNGKSNFTAILHNGDITAGITLERSEYPDRVRYEADRASWLIGELTEQPDILNYDADKHSGYVASAQAADLNERAHLAAGQWATSNTPISEALAYRDGFIAGAHFPAQASEAHVAPARASAFDVALDALRQYQQNWDTGLPAEYAQGERIAMECACEAVREALQEARAILVEQPEPHPVAPDTGSVK
ncbi:hypothetical protein [Burkholderia anthina]|uniref:hypothetical protein n=1 Tax=Burkholderia anthina TaxID=179879 RepID=UPI00158D63A3|nr:hypothetical protein [Burkholderia anthina]